MAPPGHPNAGTYSYIVTYSSNGVEETKKLKLPTGSVAGKDSAKIPRSAESITEDVPQDDTIAEQSYGPKPSVPVSGQSQLQSKPNAFVPQLMNPETFKELGLDKLSPEAAKKLDEWLSNVVEKAYNRGISDRAGRAGATKGQDVIESRIAGAFEGWDGETVFKLINGQIWQQSSYAYHYSYSYRPEVLIYRSGGGYKMRVEGVGDYIYVQRVK